LKLKNSSNIVTLAQFVEQSYIFVIINIESWSWPH